MAAGGVGQGAQQLVAAMGATTAGAAVGLVDDDELGAGADELDAAALVLDVVQADDGVRVGREDALARREVPFQTTGPSGRDGDGADVEAFFGAWEAGGCD